MSFGVLAQYPQKPLFSARPAAHGRAQFCRGRTPIDTGTRRTGGTGDRGPAGPGPGGPAGLGPGGPAELGRRTGGSGAGRTSRAGTRRTAEGLEFRSASPGLEFKSANPVIEVSQPWKLVHPDAHPNQGLPEIVKNLGRHMSINNDVRENQI